MEDKFFTHDQQPILFTVETDTTWMDAVIRHLQEHQSPELAQSFHKMFPNKIEILSYFSYVDNHTGNIKLKAVVQPSSKFLHWVVKETGSCPGLLIEQHKVGP